MRVPRGRSTKSGCKINANRAKKQISTSESRENACIFFTERGRDSTKLNLFAIFRGAAYLQAAKQIKVSANRPNFDLGFSETPPKFKLRSRLKLVQTDKNKRVPALRRSCD